MSQNKAPAVRKAFRKLWILSTLSAVVLMNLISTDTRAQDGNAACPCFTYEEVESIFMKGVHPTEEVHKSDCSAQDYSVEINAEVVVWDQGYTIVLLIAPSTYYKYKALF